MSKEIAKYDPVRDGLGDWIRFGKPGTAGGHYIEMGGYVAGIITNAEKYYKDCGGKGGNPKLPEWCWNKIKEFKRLPLPVIPMTDTEYRLNEDAARNAERFWEIVLMGDYLLGVVGTGGALGISFGGAGAGVGAGGWIPVPALAP